MPEHTLQKLESTKERVLFEVNRYLIVCFLSGNHLYIKSDSK